MKALVYTSPYEMTLREEPDPQPAPGEAVVRIAAAGICGSDMHAYHGHDPRRVPPLILGHEASGEVVTGVGAGRHVVLNPLITCGHCDPCVGGRSNLCRHRRLIGMNRPGVFAELIALPEANLIDIPDAMNPGVAALTEPAATALHALHLAERISARPLAEARTLVLGGGSVGLLSALWLRAFGCASVILGETNPLRRASAERTGACMVYDTARDPAPADGTIDLVVDAVGASATRRAALAAAAPGGIVLHIGLGDSTGETDFRKLTLAELTIIGTYTYTPVDLRASIGALHEGKLGALDWVERRPLTMGAAAFAELHRGAAAAAKIVLIPQ